MTEGELKTYAAKIMSEISDMRKVLEDIGRLRPPLELDDLRSGHNVPDDCVRRQVQAWLNTHDSFDHDGDLSWDPDEWELVSSSSRYEVRREEDDDSEWFIVWDTEALRQVSDDYADEYVAQNECDIRNNDDAIETLHGFPFAACGGYKINRWEVDSFVAAGYVVWHRPLDRDWVAGVDGGGYDFMSQHHLVAWFLEHRGDMIETSEGPRLLAPAPSNPDDSTEETYRSLGGARHV